MELAAAEARYDENHEDLPYHDGSWKRWAANRSENFPYHYRDGVRLWIAREDVDPTDDFLTPPEKYKGEDIDDD